MASKRTDPATPTPAPATDPITSAKRVTLRDIAEAVGVTPMTVSRALRNQSRISEAMREKIQAKAQAMGYHPDPALTALVHYRHNRMEAPVRAALAWLNFWPDPKQWRKYREFVHYWEGAEAAAKRQGFHLEEFIVDASMTPKRMAQILYTRNVRGILIPPGLYPEAWVGEFPWSQFSVVSIGRNRLPLHTVTSDQMANTMMAVGKMLELGYGRIGFVAESWFLRMFGAGFLWAQELKIKPADRVTPFFAPCRNAGEVEVFKPAFEKWFQRHKPDAILTENPFLLGILKSMGVRVPKDVGLAALTTLDCPIDAGVYQNPAEIGRVAVLVLQSLINDNDRGIPAINRQILIEGKWVDGSSLPSRR